MWQGKGGGASNTVHASTEVWYDLEVGSPPLYVVGSRPGILPGHVGTMRFAHNSPNAVG